LHQAYGIHIEKYSSTEEAFPQLKQRIKGERSDVRLRPSLTAFVHIFFKFDPSETTNILS
jgi:hypothetical protein